MAFTIDPVDGLGTGDEIANKASIVFDLNDPILTPTFVNTIDDTPPTSRIKSLKAKGRGCGKLAVRFAGKDKGAGIAFRDVYVSRNGRSYEPWRLRTERKKGKYAATKAGAYTFLSLATDGAGHTEANEGSLWEGLIKSAKRKGSGKLQLSFDKGGAKDLGLKSLKIKADGKRRAKLKKKLPAKLTIGGLRTGGHEIELDAKVKKGDRKKLDEERAIAMCPKTKKKKKKKR
jgi:hypothetical protein